MILLDFDNIGEFVINVIIYGWWAVMIIILLICLYCFINYKDDK